MKIKDDLRQRHLEAFEETYLNGESKKGRNTDNGAVVRAAQKAGWLDGDIGDVGDMMPRDVIKLAQEINRRYVEMTTLDPN